MMYISFLCFISSTVIVKAQLNNVSIEHHGDSLIIVGGFLNENIYVQNPYSQLGDGKFFSAQKLFVNDSLVLSAAKLAVSAFEIPLKQLGLKIGDCIRIVIVQRPESQVKILTPMNCGQGHRRKS